MNRTFLTYALSFFIPVILGYVLVESITLSLPSPFEINKVILEEKANEIQTLILGSSQMSHAINAELLSNHTINLASGNQHHNTDLKLFKALHPRLKNLKTVIIEVSYSHFELPHNGKDFWKNSVFLKYYDVNCFERVVYFKDKLIYLSFPSFFSEKIIDHYWTKEDPSGFNSFAFDTLNYNGTFKNLLYDEKRIAEIPNFKINTIEDPEIFEINSQFFFEMLDVLYRSGVDVILCSPPMYKTYLHRRNPAILQRRDSILQVALKKYSNITIISKEEDTLSFDVKDYWNQSHLNPNGAMKFTKMIDNVIAK